VAPLEEPLDRGPVALEDSFHRPVEAVLDPPGQACRGRLARTRMSEEDALNAAGYDNARAG
jgi:hypothetical protein